MGIGKRNEEPFDGMLPEGLTETEDGQNGKKEKIFTILLYICLVFFLAVTVMKIRGLSRGGELQENAAVTEEAGLEPGTAKLIGVDTEPAPPDMQDTEPGTALQGEPGETAETAAMAGAQSEGSAEPEEATAAADPAGTAEPDTEWETVIFGAAETSVVRHVTATGLTAAQKEKTGYQEAAFLRMLSAFLEMNNLPDVTSVVFEEEIKCFAEDAYAFRVSLEGREDKVLNVIMYPDYPGQYILTLQDAQEVSVTVQAQTEAQAEPQAQQAQGPAQGGAVQTERAYDAAALSVTGIPATLLNYLANRYELQYTLYDYLWQNGRYNVTGAEVSSYEIDADSRMVTISFLLSDGSGVTGVYDRDANTYSYR